MRGILLGSCACPGANRVKNQRYLTMPLELTLYLCMTASAVLQIIHIICELAGMKNKRR